MESFFAPMQMNVLDRRWNTRGELRLTIVTWIKPSTTGGPASSPSSAVPIGNAVHQCKIN
jgi:hypothetical protein